jgi:FKBP-type peptidyl-prolyl cis-trans isomerase SlyD
MQIAAQKVVILNYTLKDQNGSLIDESRDGSFAYLHGANNIIPGLEEALTGKSTGDSLSVAIEPENAYGARDDNRVETVPRSMFPTDTPVEPGMQFHAQGPQGQMITISVVSVQDETVTIDANHPLAGMQLHFDVEVIDVRDASKEELDHGHVHGPQGHAHD